MCLFLSWFWSQGNRASWGLKNRAVVRRNAPATKENRATLVHSVSLWATNELTLWHEIIPKNGCQNRFSWMAFAPSTSLGVKEMDVAFLLTVGSFLLTVELFYLQLTILAFFTYDWSLFACSFIFSKKSFPRRRFSIALLRSWALAPERSPDTSQNITSKPTSLCCLSVGRMRAEEVVLCQRACFCLLNAF